MKLVFKNDTIQKEFSIDILDKKTKMFNNVLAEFEHYGVHIDDQFSYSSFKRLIDDSSASVKGWTVTTVNPTASMVSTRNRNVSVREQERADRKAQKRAERAAKRNVANGNRNRLGSQKRYKQAKEAKALNKTPKMIKHSILSSTISQVIYNS